MSTGLPVASRVSIAAYDIRGREVARLANSRQMEAGYHTLVWEPKDLPSGIYTCRMVADDFTQSRRIVYIGGE